MTMVSTVLDSQEHARLMSDIDHIAQVAGVQVKYIHQSMKDVCGETEINWVKSYHKNRVRGIPGLVLEGVANPDSVCQSITGALLRNFIDARVIPLNQLLALQAANDLPEPSVLLIPNLFVKMAEGAKSGIPAWKMQAVYDVLLGRATRNMPTVVYIQDREEMQKAYGVPFANFLDQFVWVKG
jgi:hypothetical protein